MGWDEKVDAYADRNTMFDPSREYKDLVAEGARWQREQFRTDEAVERVARKLLNQEWRDQGDREHHWEYFADSYRDCARAVIAALIEEA